MNYFRYHLRLWKESWDVFVHLGLTTWRKVSNLSQKNQFDNFEASQGDHLMEDFCILPTPVKLDPYLE